MRLTQSVPVKQKADCVHFKSLTYEVFLHQFFKRLLYFAIHKTVILTLDFEIEIDISDVNLEEVKDSHTLGEVGEWDT